MYSVAGLLAARVCHDHFEHVIIVEPEAWLSTDEGREVTLWPESQSRARLIQYNSLHCKSSEFLFILWELIQRRYTTVLLSGHAGHVSQLPAIMQRVQHPVCHSSLVPLSAHND